MVLNIRNEGTIKDLNPDDVIEVPCDVNREGPHRISIPPPPEAVRGLLVAVKTYERLTIEAAIKNDRALSRLALFTNPMVADWEAAQSFLNRL